MMGAAQWAVTNMILRPLRFAVRVAGIIIAFVLGHAERALTRAIESQTPQPPQNWRKIGRERDGFRLEREETTGRERLVATGTGKVLKYLEKGE